MSGNGNSQRALSPDMMDSDPMMGTMADNFTATAQDDGRPPALYVQRQDTNDSRARETTSQSVSFGADSTQFTEASTTRDGPPPPRKARGTLPGGRPLSQARVASFSSTQAGRSADLGSNMKSYQEPTVTFVATARRGPLELRRIAQMAQVPGAMVEDGAAGRTAAPLLVPTESDAPPPAPLPEATTPTGTSPATSPSAAPPPPPLVAVGGKSYYGQRGATVEADLAAEAADEVAPAGFDDVAYHGGVRGPRLRNPYVSVAAALIVPLVFLLICSAALFGSVARRPILKSAIDISLQLDSAATSLCDEQTIAGYLGALSTNRVTYTGTQLQGYYTLWNTELLDYSDRQTTVNDYLSGSATAVGKVSGPLQNLLDGMNPWAYVNMIHLEWLRVQSEVSSQTFDVITDYDDTIRQLLLYNGALSLMSTVHIASDVENLHGLFSLEMYSVASMMRLFLQMKQVANAPTDGTFATPANADEVQFIVKALATMRVAETTLRFATDNVAAYKYMLQTTAGSAITDVSTIAVLKFIDLGNGLYSIGFSDEVQSGLMQMIADTYKPEPFTLYNNTAGYNLYLQTLQLTQEARDFFSDQLPVLQKVVTKSQAMRAAALIVLMILCGAGILYHCCRVLIYLRSDRYHHNLNHYARQMRGSLLRMHATGQKMTHLRLEDTSAEVKLAGRPQLRTITAEEREMYLGVDLLRQVEPFLPLPMRHPPPFIPETALVNQSLFVKPVFVVRKGLVAIRLDFSVARQAAAAQAERERQRAQQDHSAPQSAQQSAQQLDSEVMSGGGPLSAGRPCGRVDPTGPSKVSFASISTSPSAHPGSMKSAGEATVASSRVGGGSHHTNRDGPLHRRLSRDGGGPENGPSPGRVETDFHACMLDMLRVFGALAGARPAPAGRRDKTMPPSRGAYMQSNGHTTTVWLNLCDDIPNPNVFALYICSAFVRHCRENDKPCPAIVICSGDGVVGNVSSYRERPVWPAAPAVTRPRYEDMWAHSAFFAEGGEAPEEMAARAEEEAAAEAAVAGDSAGAAAGSGADHRAAGGRKGGRQQATGVDSLIVAIAGLSKRARAALWMRRLLGLKYQTGAGGDAIAEDGAGAKETTALLRAQDAASAGGGASSGASGKRAGHGQGAAAGGRSTMLASDLSAVDALGTAEKVPLPAVLPPPYAPGAPSACLTSVIVYGEIANELEAVHSLSIVHGQPVMMNEAVVQGAMREQEELSAAPENARRKRAAAGGAIPTFVSAATTVTGSCATATTMDGMTSSPDPIVCTGLSDRRYTINTNRMKRAMRGFTFQCVPVDMTEERREFVPVYDTHTIDHAAEKRKKKKKSRSREAGGGAEEASPITAAEAAAAAELARPMNLELAFPPVDGGGRDAGGHRIHPPLYRRTVDVRTPTVVPPSLLPPDLPTERLRHFTSISTLRAVYALLLPRFTRGVEVEDEDDHDDIAWRWVTVFNRYARLCYATAATEPALQPLRSRAEREQLKSMALDVKSAVDDLQAGAGIQLGEPTPSALLLSTSTHRLCDVAAAVEGYVANGPAPSAAVEPPLFRDALLSSEAIDVSRLLSGMDI